MKHKAILANRRVSVFGAKRNDLSTTKNAFKANANFNNETLQTIIIANNKIYPHDAVKEGLILPHEQVLTARVISTRFVPETKSIERHLPLERSQTIERDAAIENNVRSESRISRTHDANLKRRFL